ncbi:MAG: GntR family transcriptional regulator [Pseudomonadota bacterium]
MPSDRIEAVPLYRMVQERLISQIEDGTLKPGAALPNEFQLADQMGVSQGTVRKALIDLEKLGVIERRQGRGTFVKTETPERSMFHFFRLSTGDGARIVPKTHHVQLSTRTASPAERAAFEEVTLDRVFEISRQRRYEDRPLADEIIVLRGDFFSGLETPQDLPNALYPFYQEAFHISILRAEERISAVPASESEAQALAVAVGAPLLKVDRRARDIRDRPVELRRSLFVTGDLTYDVDLS